MKKYPDNIRKFIEKNHVGNGPKLMTELLNKTFETNYTRAQIKSYYVNYKISSGLDGRFKKGHIPQNNVKKGHHVPGSEKGWFKKGNEPHTTMPVGTEVERTNGYIWVKVAAPNKWRQKHILVWEKKNGKVPEGHVVTFLDGNKANVTLNNLALISLAESMELTRSNLRSENPNITETGILIARTKTLARSKAKEMEGLK